MDWASFGGAGMEIGKFLLPVLSTVLVIVLSALAKKLVDKLGVNRSVQIDEMIDKYVAIGVKAAERVATNKIGSSETLRSGDKMSLATKTVLSELEQSGIKGVAEELIKARIEHYLEVKDPKEKPKVQ